MPSPKKPLIFYSNHLRDDLRLVVLKAIQKAKSSIFLQIYGLSDPSIINLLEQKKAEGISLTIFYDKKGSKHLPHLLGGHPVKSSGLMHRKIIVIDNTLVFLGTANFTTQSLKIHDNLMMGAWSSPLATFLQDSIGLEESFEIGGSTITSFLLPDFEKRAIEQLGTCIDCATKTIKVAMFTLTHPVLVQKLIQAHKRSVNVVIAIDRYTAQGASQKAIAALEESGIAILQSQGSQLLHHKWALIDDETLILGSANWTQAAFSNNQDYLLICKKLKAKEQKTLKKIWKLVAIAA